MALKPRHFPIWPHHDARNAHRSGRRESNTLHRVGSPRSGHQTAPATEPTASAALARARYRLALSAGTNRRSRSGCSKPIASIPVDAPLHEVNGEVEVLGNAPSESACKADAQPSGHPRCGPGRYRPCVHAFGERVGASPRTRSDPGENRTLLAPWTAAQPHQMLTGPCKSPRRESDPTSCLRSAAPASGRSRRLGDARVLRPSKTGPQPAGFSCSLASQSAWRESNALYSGPNGAGNPYPTRCSDGAARVERASSCSRNRCLDR